VTIRYQADNDLKSAIQRGVRRREPAIDFQSARTASFDSLDDLEVLERASRELRILVSHDVNSMPVAFERFLSTGRPSPGLFLAPQDARIGKVVESLVIVWVASDSSEWENQLVWLPL